MSVHGSESSLKESSYFSSTVFFHFLVSKSSKSVAPAAPFSSSLGTWWLSLFLVPSVVPKLPLLESLCGPLSSFLGPRSAQKASWSPAGFPFGTFWVSFVCILEANVPLSAPVSVLRFPSVYFLISNRSFSVSFRFVFTVVATACYRGRT